MPRDCVIDQALTVPPSRRPRASGAGRLPVGFDVSSGLGSPAMTPIESDPLRSRLRPLAESAPARTDRESAEAEDDAPLVSIKLTGRPRPRLAEEPIEFVVKSKLEGRRLDTYLTSRFPDYSRSVIQKVIDANAVMVNGKPARASQKVREGDFVSLRLPELWDGTIPAQDIPLTVIYEDQWLSIIDKPAGMVTHPGKGNWSGTVVNALQHRYDTLSQLAGSTRPGVVHRLDRDTTGLLIVARDDTIHGKLAQLFETRTIEKEYLAICSGIPERDRDWIDQPLGPHPTVREKMAIRGEADGGRPARTFYEVVERFDRFALVRCQPLTGRTHQIRVHLTHVGLPILADKLYSGRDRITRGDLLGSQARGDDHDHVLLTRQALHAHRLKFLHPATGEPLEIRSPLPPDMAETLETLRQRPAASSTNPTRFSITRRL